MSTKPSFNTKTLSQQMWAQNNIHEAISNLKNIVFENSEKIVGVREPIADLSSETEKQFKEVEKLRGRPLFYPYIGSGLGRGPYVELTDGSVKLDLINGIGIHVLGHSHPEVVQASIEGALADVVMQGHLQANESYISLSQKLVDLAAKNSRLRHVWLTTCGTMANENALKIARQKKTPARMVIAMKDAFAGRSTMMAEVTDNPAFKEGLPEYHEILRIPFCNKGSGGLCQTSCGKDKALTALKELVAKHEGNISCFVFEPMLGEGGYRVPCSEYFLPLLDFCKTKGIPIWADEVQTFCRTGQFFAYETLGFGHLVDIVTVAKTAQVGATLYTEEFNPKPGLIAGTFAGASASFTAGLKVLEILEQGHMGPEGKIQKIHNSFVKMLNQLNETSCKGLLQEAGGLGLMVAVTPLDGSKEKVMALLKALFNNGLMSFSCGRGPYRLRFLIPAVMTEADIEVAKTIIEKSVLELA